MPVTNTELRQASGEVKIARLFCHRFRANQVGLWSSVIAYTPGNLWRGRLLGPAPPKKIERWSRVNLIPNRREPIPPNPAPGNFRQALWVLTFAVIAHFFGVSAAKPRRAAQETPSAVHDAAASAAGFAKREPA